MKSFYMGIDIGTGATKAVVFNPDGKPVASSCREYPLRSPHPGWAELDAEEVISKCFEVISESARKSPGPVAALAVSAQGEAFAAVDAAGKALSAAPVSSDTRAAQLASSWSGPPDVERLYQITGHTPHPLFTLFKLLWIRANLPQVWKSAVKFLCFEDLLLMRLGVEPMMSWSMGGRTMLFDVREHIWSPEVLSAIGLEESRLAKPAPGGAIAGTIRPALARELGLADGAQAVVGAHDQVCGALGAGATRDGLAVYATGSVECLTSAFSKPVFTDDLRRNNLNMYDHAVPGLYANLAYSLTGGNILRWFRDQFGAEDTRLAAQSGKSAYELLLAEAGTTPTPLVVMPYFTPTGTPHFDAQVTGAILGLRLSSTRGQVVRALLEGVALEMRLNLDILHRSGGEVREFRAIGGGARSDMWNQLKADVVNKPIRVPDIVEAGCLGAAMLARSACENTSVQELADRQVRIRSECRPRPKYAAWYEKRFDLYQKLYPTLGPILRDESFRAGPA